MENDFTSLVSVSGLPGLYRVVANRHNGLIIEDLKSGQKRFAPTRSHQFSLLASIGIYTEEGTEDLKDVFLRMISHDAKIPDSNVTKEPELRAYFRQILPEYDEEMVRVNDIRKVIKWFHVLHELNLLPIQEKVKSDAKSKVGSEEE